MIPRKLLIGLAIGAACLVAVLAAGAVWVLRLPGLPLQPVPDASAEGSSVRISMRDSSVPPNYHRSFTIEVDERFAWIQVRSYGAVVGARRVELSGGFYRRWLQRHRSDLAWLARHWGPRDVPGCTGGRGFGVEIWVGETGKYSDRFEACGAKGRAAADRVTALSDEIRALFGDTVFHRGESFSGQSPPTPVVPEGRPAPEHRPTGAATPDPTASAP